MKLKVVPIGNSKGIRIPKAVLKHCEIADALDLRLEDKRIILTPVSAKPRQGWAAAAERMHRAGDDELLIPDVFEDEGDAEC